MSGTLFRGGVYDLVPNNNPIALPNGVWTIGIKLNIPFVGGRLDPGINEWGTLLSAGWYGIGFNEIKWYINTAGGFISTNYGAKDTNSTGSMNLGGCTPANHPIPKGDIWLFLRRHADGTFGETYVEEGSTFANFFANVAPNPLTAGIGGMTASGGTAPTEWYLGNIPDFGDNIAKDYWLQVALKEVFITDHLLTNAEIQSLASTATPVTVPTIVGGQANLIRHYKFDNAPDTLTDLSNNAKNGVWVVPNYSSSIAPWYPTISKLPIPDQVLTDPSYTAGYTRSFAAVGNTAGFTDTGLTVVSGAFQVRSNILIADAINTRSKVRLTTIPNDTVYLRAEYVNVWNNDGDPTYVGIGLCTSDGTSGYELEGATGGFVVREIKSGATTLSATASNQGDDLNRTYAVELDDGYINFYSKASGSSVYVLRSRMPNTIGSQLYPTYISETTSGGLGKGASALLFETAEAVGGSVVAPTYSGNFTATVAENTTAVGTFPVTTTGGGTVTYSLTGADAARFNINSSTAVVTFASAPDFESPNDDGTNNVYNFNVVATNNGGANTASTAVTLTITDATDTAAGIIFTIRDSSTNGSPFLASGTSVTMTVYADGTPDIVEVYNGTIGANGSVTFTDNTWVVGANKVCVLEAGGIKQGGIPFQVVSIPV